MRSSIYLAIIALTLLPACFGGCDPEAMSGCEYGRAKLAQRAQQSTKDIAKLEAEVRELERQVAKVEETNKTCQRAIQQAQEAIMESRRGIKQER